MQNRLLFVFLLLLGVLISGCQQYFGQEARGQQVTSPPQFASVPSGENFELLIKLDVDDDGDIDTEDYLAFSTYFGTVKGGPSNDAGLSYDGKYDFNNDEKIDNADFLLLNESFGETFELQRAETFLAATQAIESASTYSLLHSMDSSGNGVVDSEDFFAFANVYGTEKDKGANAAGFSYDSRFDFNYDEEINMDDFFIFSENFNKKIDIPTVVLDSCREITQSGYYVLDTDLQSSRESCLKVHDVDRVHIACEGHTITVDARGDGLVDVAPVVFSNVEDFSLSSCKLTIINPFPRWDYNALLIFGSRNGALLQNDFLGWVRVRQGVGIQTTANHFFNTFYHQEFSSDSLIEDNRFEAGQRTSGSCVIGSNFGSYTHIQENHVDGGSDGIFSYSNHNGFDDGICLGDESHAVIADNTIVNSWDCGIETSGVITDTQITGNKISNQGYCGIGAWYWSSWKDNNVENNIVEKTPVLFAFLRAFGLRPKGFGGELLTEDTSAYFRDNTFRDNKLVQQQKIPPGVNGFNFNFISQGNLYGGQKAIAVEDMIISNNILTRNDFGVKDILIVKPAHGFVDGGGNVCTLDIDSAPLKCTSPSRA